MDEEYLKLFQKIKEQEKQESGQMLKETPNYDQLQNLNEVYRQPQPQNFNINEFNIETRIDGQKVKKINEADPNGLNQFLKEERLNEIKRIQQQEKLNEVLRIKEQERLNAIKEQQRLEEQKRQEEERKRQEELERLNENINFQDADVVTLDMFNRASYNSMMKVWSYRSADQNQKR